MWITPKFYSTDCLKYKYDNKDAQKFMQYILKVNVT